MTPSARRGTLFSVIAAAAVGLVAWTWTTRPAATPEYQGWVEAYFIYVSPDETGRVETLSVKEGDHVETGQALFALDADLQRAAVAEAEATVTNARVTFDRAKELLKRAVGSQKTYDDAEAALRTGDARLNSARTRLERRRLSSPVSGTVQEIYFRVGEMVSAGRPIVSLLPPGNTRVRFFVPESVVPRLRVGDAIAVHCDGCASDLTARINFVSAQAEFTPPVIYSLDERSRLVFRIEAIPDTPEKLRVGQPVSISLPAAAAPVGSSSPRGEGAPHAER